ncbi:MAG: MerR family transcriptional regulator, partial [Roseibium sp.]|uniref:MerR family transcriptional regulator n=1 Tax=Roseibium sp. TaxID=1936156 RepID=UPI0026143617
MKIGELSEKSGLTRDTIRFYERNGLLKSRPGESETNNYRDYPEENLLRLDFVSNAREAGMSIADLKDIVDTMEGSCDMDIARKVIGVKIEELKDRKKQIQNVIKF